MGTIQRIKRNIYEFLLQRKISRSNAKREVVQLSEASRIGILYDASQPENTITVSRFSELLKQQGKDVSLLGFVNEQRNDFSDKPSLFNKKELNWMQQPISEKVQTFIKSDFDILINAWMGEQLTLEYIAALSNARYRVGEYSRKKTFCNEMMIDVHGRQELSYLVDQIAHYLNVFKPHAQQV